MPGSRSREVSRLAELFAALSHPRRVVIVECLLDGEKSVGELCDCDRLAGSKQPNMSQHLGVLKRAGLLKERRDGNRVYYATTSPKIKELLRTGGQISLQRLRALL